MAGFLTNQIVQAEADVLCISDQQTLGLNHLGYGRFLEVQRQPATGVDEGQEQFPVAQYHLWRLADSIGL